MGPTRALENVTIRARVRGFLTEPPFRRRGPGQEGAALARDRRGAVPGGPPRGAGPPGRGRRRTEEGRGIEGARGLPRRNWISTGPSFCSPRSRNAQPGARRLGTPVRPRSSTRPRPIASGGNRRSRPDRANLAQAKTDYAVGISSAQAQVSARQGRPVRDGRAEPWVTCRMYAPLQVAVSARPGSRSATLVGPGSRAGGGAYTDHRHDPAT